MGVDLSTSLSFKARLSPAWTGSILALVCAAPLGAVLALAVLGPWTGYLQHIAETRLVSYLTNTVLVGITTLSLAGLIGTLSAWLVTRYIFPGRKILEWAFALPLAVPAYAAAYAWYDLTQSAGPLGGYLPVVRGPIGAGFIFGITLYPYVYLLARESFLGQSREAYEAARTLGCSPLSAFTRAALPMARPALAVGLALVLMETLADFGAVVHLGAPTLSVGIIRAWAGEGSVADAARLALMLVALALVIFSIERSQRRRARQTNASGQQKPIGLIPLGTTTGWIILAFSSLPLLAGLIIPIGRLGWRALNTTSQHSLWPVLMNSLQLAVIAGVIAAVLGLLAAYAIRTGKPWPRVSVRLAGLGYAVPGAVAAVGVLGLFGALQSGLDNGWERLTGHVFPILLSGGIAGLIFAYLSRFAAAAIGPSEAALNRVTPTMDGAARTLGASGWSLFSRVHWPIIAPGILLAGLLVFVEVLKELPATMILRPFNFDTLAVLAHNYASDERLGEAALPALMIVLTALPAMVWIARQMTRQRSTLPGDET